jgi:hypothetical protein
LGAQPLVNRRGLAAVRFIGFAGHGGHKGSTESAAFSIVNQAGENR